MNAKERNVFARRWLTDEPAKLRELSEEMGVTKQRIQQLERQALAKMGTPHVYINAES